MTLRSAFFVLLVCALLLAPGAFADPVYQVSGALVIVGNSGCNPATCTETINFTFQLAPTVVADQLRSGFQFLNISTLGPLSGVSGSNPQESFGGPSYFQEVQSFVQGSCATPFGFCTEIDFSYVLQQMGSSYAFSGFSPQFFTCEGTCGQNFTSDGQGCFGYGACSYAPIIVDGITVTQVPEPTAFNLLLIGGTVMLLLGAGFSLSRSRRPSRSGVIPPTDLILQRGSLA